MKFYSVKARVLSSQRGGGKAVLNLKDFDLVHFLRLCPKDRIEEIPPEVARGKVKFEVWGEEMIEKKVKLSGNSGRVYLPPDWVNHQVKIIRVD